MLILISLLFQSITINHQSVNKIEFSFKPIFSIGIDDEGFYDSARIFYSESRYIVFDKGNSLIKIYDNRGLFKFEFGEEGNGPDQLSNTEITVIKNRIIAIKRAYISLFDFGGKLIKTIKIDPKRKAFIVESENGFYIYYKHYKKNDMLFKEYSLNAKFMKSKKANSNNKVKALDVPLEESLKRFIFNEYHTNSDYFYFNQNYYNYQNGEFSLSKYSRDFQKLENYHYGFNRIPIDEKLEKKYLYSKGKRDYVLEKIVNNYRADIYNGYLSDIVKFNGINSDYLFITLEAKSNENRETIVLNKEMEKISQFKFYQKDLKSWSISKNRLLAYFKNDEIGPHFKIFELIETQN